MGELFLVGGGCRLTLMRSVFVAAVAAVVRDFAAAERDREADRHGRAGRPDRCDGQQQEFPGAEHPADRLDQRQDADDGNIGCVVDDEAQQDRHQHAGDVRHHVDPEHQALEVVGLDTGLLRGELGDVPDFRDHHHREDEDDRERHGEAHRVQGKHRLAPHGEQHGAEIDRQEEQSHGDPVVEETGAPQALAQQAGLVALLGIHGGDGGGTTCAGCVVHAGKTSRLSRDMRDS